MIPLGEVRRRLNGYRPGMLAGRMTADDYADAEGTVRRAAVLIAMIANDAEPSLLMTVRSGRMRHHAGQVAFPGGRLDPGETAIEAALREAEEEVALLPARVEVLGPIDDYATGTGFRVTPIVGIVRPGERLIPNEAEVAEIFELPLTRALDSAHHLENEAEWKGRRRRYYTVDWSPQRVWGATAGMIVNLARILEARA